MILGNCRRIIMSLAIKTKQTNNKLMTIDEFITLHESIGPTKTEYGTNPTGPGPTKEPAGFSNKNVEQYALGTGFSVGTYFI